MAPASNEEQFKFLISCIRYSNNGKVDFGEVARECGIVTKGAAAKRYERMMKAHGIHDKAAPVRETPTPYCRKATTERSSSNKKSKLSHFPDTNGTAADDDEGLTRVKGEVESTVIKNEPAMDGEPPVASNGFQFEPVDVDRAGKADDVAIFNDFLQAGAYDSSVLVPQPSCSGIGQNDMESTASTAFSGTGHALHESILIAD